MSGLEQLVAGFPRLFGEAAPEGLGLLQPGWMALARGLFDRVDTRLKPRLNPRLHDAQPAEFECVRLWVGDGFVRSGVQLGSDDRMRVHVLRTGERRYLSSREPEPLALTEIHQCIEVAEARMARSCAVCGQPGVGARRGPAGLCPPWCARHAPPGPPNLPYPPESPRLPGPEVGS